MKIGIDCRTILNPLKGERAGVGYYTYYLVKHLLKLDKKNQYVLFFDYRVKDTSPFKQKNVVIKYFPFSQYKKFLPFSYSHMLISAFLIRENLDLYHSPANVIPYAYNKPSVVTVHDLAIYKHPKFFPSGQKFSTKFLVPKSLKKTKKIIAVSETTKKDIVKLFKIPAAKIKVIYEGFAGDKVKVAEAATLKKYKLASPYILFVGTIEPRKNLVGLIQAFAEVNKDRRLKNYQLILAGAEGWKDEKVFKTIQDLKLGMKIKYLGYVSHDDKLNLMRRATCFVFPSFYEGFGLPVLEAMAIGTPVITSNLSSLPEVAGQAAILVNPAKKEEITKALKKVLGNEHLRQQMSNNGREQARKFSWSKCVQETLKVYQGVFKAQKEEKDRKKAKKEKGKKKK